MGAISISFHFKLCSVYIQLIFTLEGVLVPGRDSSSETLIIESVDPNLLKGAFTKPLMESYMKVTFFAGHLSAP